MYWYADVFEIYEFPNMCLEINEFSTLLIFYCTRIIMTSSLKKDQNKIRSII